MKTNWISRRVAALSLVPFLAIATSAGGLTLGLTAQERAVPQEKQEKQDKKDPQEKKAEAAPAVPADPNAQAFIQMLVKNVDNKSPRVRFAMREALVAMGHQSVVPLKDAKAAQTNEYVKRFIDRTLKRVKSAAKAAKRKNRFLSAFANRGRDIDRIAMDLNLTWVQMDKMLPIFKKYDEDRKALMKEMRDSGGFGDMEAWKDLQEELKLMREDAEPEFAKFLDKNQAKRALRYLGQGGAFGGMPISIGDLGGGSVQIFGGPEGGGTVRILKRGGGDPDK